MSFIKVKVTFELTLYEGRLDKPYENTIFDLWFHDEFLGFAINYNYLRDGESIELIAVEDVTKEDGG